MTCASIVTIGDEIIIGQVVDTNSACLAGALEQAGIHVRKMLSVPDDAVEMEKTLSEELSASDIVISTGGLGPTKDDITKPVLARLSGSSAYIEHPGQMKMVHSILHGRGLDVLPVNLAQAQVPDKAEVIVNKLGTAPIMVFRQVRGGGTLYALPGVPHEAEGAIPAVMADIRAHQKLQDILHRSVMVYGIAESALSEKLAPWEDALPKEMHLAYLPNTLTGIRLRLSIYSGNSKEQEALLQREFGKLKLLLGNLLYSEEDSDLQTAVGKLLKDSGKTLSAAESCTGGEIAHLITSVPGASAYFLGSVTSYAVPVKEKVLGVSPAVIREKGVVSSEVAAAMAEGVRRLTGSDYAVSTTGLAGPSGDQFNPVGTVWIGVAGPSGTTTATFCFKHDRKRNIERFAACALNFLRLQIEKDLNH